MKYRQLSSIFYQDKELYEQIYHKRIDGESTYKFNFNIGNYNGFVVITHDILERIEKIIELDKTLLILMNNLPGVAVTQYTKKCLIDEIKMTNDIEGVYSTRKEINDLLVDNTKDKEFKRFYGLVRKYEMLLGDEKIELSSCVDVRKLYNEFALKDVVAEDTKNAPDGAIFRKDQVQIMGSNQRSIHEGLYPEDKIITTMSESLKMLNDDNYNFFIRIAVFHYMFGYIHPFYDGNGRMSRFISSYLLAQKLQYLVACRLSCAIKNKLSTYYKMFKVTNEETNRGDITHFVVSFFDLIIDSILDLCEALKDRKDKLNYYYNILTNKFIDTKKQTVAFILVQNTLFGDTGISVEEIKESSNIGDTTIRRLLKELEGENLLRIKVYGKKKVYDIELGELDNK